MVSPLHCILDRPAVSQRNFRTGPIRYRGGALDPAGAQIVAQLFQACMELGVHRLAPRKAEMGEEHIIAYTKL